MSNKSKLTPTNPDNAIFFKIGGALAFGGESIDLFYCDPLNKQGGGVCYTNG